MLLCCCLLPMNMPVRKKSPVWEYFAITEDTKFVNRFPRGGTNSQTYGMTSLVQHLRAKHIDVYKQFQQKIAELKEATSSKNMIPLHQLFLRESKDCILVWDINKSKRSSKHSEKLKPLSLPQWTRDSRHGPDCVWWEDQGTACQYQHIQEAHKGFHTILGEMDECFTSPFQGQVPSQAPCMNSYAAQRGRSPSVWAPKGAQTWDLPTTNCPLHQLRTYQLSKHLVSIKSPLIGTFDSHMRNSAEFATFTAGQFLLGGTVLLSFAVV